MEDEPIVYVPDEIKEEDITRFTDDAGNTTELIKSHGMQQAVYELRDGAIPDFRSNIPRIQAMESRQDDVYICAYPKAGTHWVWEITKMLIKGNADYEKKSKETVTVEFHNPKEFDNLPSPRIFNTHLPHRCLPRDLPDKRCKLIFIQRNPKDVAVSFYNHTKKVDFKFYDGDWDHYLKLFMAEKVFFQGWFDYTLDWERILDNNKDYPILQLYYEEMKQNPESEIKKIADFLEVQCDAEFIREVADKCSFKNMKNVNTKTQFNFSGGAMDVGAMFRKGIAGDWKNWFTVSQNEEFDNLYYDKMKNCKFQYTYC